MMSVDRLVTNGLVVTVDIRRTIADASLLPASEIARRVTCDAPAALGLGAWIDSLEPGKRADLILF